jgi:cytochrome P450
MQTRAAKSIAIGNPPTRRTAPGPAGVPVLGALPALLRDRLGAYEDALRRYGDVVRFVVGPPGARRVLHGVFHPDGVQQVLTTRGDRYTKREPVFDEIAATFGGGLLTYDGDEWRARRGIIQPLFTRHAVEGYADAMAEEACLLVERWRRRTTRPVDLHADCMRYAMRVVGRAIFGSDVDRAFPVLAGTLPMLSRRAIRRGLAPVRVPARWPTTGNRRAARARRDLLAFVDDLIAERRRRPGSDLISRMLADLDESMVRDEAVLFLFGGHETTAVAITFTLTLLGRNPTWQQRVRAEVDDIIGDRLPSYADVVRLANTTRVVQEALRLYPPAYAMARLVSNDEEIGGYGLPAGSIVIVSPWTTHRHPEFWDEPQRFDPERFTPERAAGRHRYAYLPFGAGPRACIGGHFAMLEAQIATAVVLQSLRVSTFDRSIVPDATGLTLRPPRGLTVAMYER